MKSFFRRFILVSLVGMMFYHNECHAQEGFGWVDIASDNKSSGASMYVDGEFVTTIPAKLKIPSGKHKVIIVKDKYLPFEKECDVLLDKTLCLSISLKASGDVVELSTAAHAELWIDGKFEAKGSWKGFITYGKHIVESRVPGCVASTLDIDFSATSEGKYIIVAPKPLTGTANFTSSPSGALVRIDGQEVGNTPIMIRDNLTVGSHYVEMIYNGASISKDVEIEEGETTEVAFEFPAYTLVNVKTKPTNAQLVVNGEVLGETPLKTHLKEGSYNISVYAKKYRKLEKNVSISGNETSLDLRLKRQYITPSAFYLSAEYQFMGISGIKGSIGGFIKNVNIEANTVISLSSSETIYWNNPSTMTTPYGYEYKPLYLGARVGYGFIVGNRLRLTPQIGGGYVSLTGTVISEGMEDPLTTNGYCVSGVVGLRVDFAIAPSVALTLTPNYLIPISKSGLYEQLSVSSKTIKNYASGFAGSAGICIFF